MSRAWLAGLFPLWVGIGSPPVWAEVHGDAPERNQDPKAESSRGTEVCGTLRLAQEWTKEGSPYIVTGDIFVPVTSRLRIGPGVVVKVMAKPKPCVISEWEKIREAESTHAMADGGEGHATASGATAHIDSHSAQTGSSKAGEHDGKVEGSASNHDSQDGVNSHIGATSGKGQDEDERDPLMPPPPADFSDSNYTSLTIEGAFYCIGTPKEPVRFMPYDTTQGSLLWDAIRLSGQREGRAEIGFTEIQGANTGLFVDHAEMFVHHVLFTDNNTGMWCSRYGNVTPVFCVFARNRSTGLFIEHAAPHVVNNIFWENRGYGIWSDGSKSMVIEYNAFFGNAEEDCYRCAHDILPLGDDGLPDSTDAFHNLRTDPIFEGSQSFLEKRQIDPRYDTPDHLVKDTAIAAAEKKTRWLWWKKQKATKPFTPRGQGPYRLSEYSPLVHAGHPARLLRNPDDSRSDMGLFGGPEDRMTRNPFPGM